MAKLPFPPMEKLQTSKKLPMPGKGEKMAGLMEAMMKGTPKAKLSSLPKSKSKNVLGPVEKQKKKK